MLSLPQVTAEYNSTHSVSATYNSGNAVSYPNGTWSATLTGLRAGSRYNVYVTSLAGELLQASSSHAGPIVVLTVSSKC